MRAIATDENGNNFECNNQETMVPVIAESNKIRQEQCLDTPFMMEPLLLDFGYLANEENAKKVLEGVYTPPEGTCPNAIEFIETLKMPVSIRNLESVGLEVSAKQNKEAWKKQKEKTASACGTIGFNHYKTCSYDEQLNEIDTFIRNLPVTVGFSPKEWMQITNLQILKRSGEFHVDRMRCIQLYDAEKNMVNKHLGRAMLAHAEKAKAICDEQYGSRKNHKAIMACLNKELIMDLFRQKRHAGAIGIIDAKGCFDHIIHTVAILVF